MNPLAFLNPGRWLLYLAAAVAAVVAYNLWANRQQEIGRKEVRAEWAAETVKQQADALARSRDNAKETVRRIDRQTEAQDANDKTLARLRVERDDSAAERDRLRGDIDLFAAATRGSPGNPGTVTDSKTAGTAVDLLAELYSRADERAGILAEALDRSYAAGIQCERSYLALTK